MTPDRWRQLEDLYRAAQKCPPNERSALLEGTDQEIRSRLERMLEIDPSGQIVDQSPQGFPDDPTRNMLGAGAHLGPYKIEAQIGAGGMGEVYRARDTRLNRLVAIKILPPRLAGSAESRDRFEREARMIASLNHPHICTLHDVGHHGETDYLVMEFLEGETLASRLRKGPLPLEQTLLYAIQISDALDKAHRKGMTHRDLKPGNIMITKSGAKLLDFGLAKLKQSAPAAEVRVSEVPTAINTITAQGSIVGTLQYMAPEQLEGKETDARTDIFALGAVLYEMATGVKAFDGKSQASIIAKILDTDPPPMSSLQPMTPAALDRVVRTCLAKDPDKRLQSVLDLKLELEWMRDAAAEPSELAAATRPDSWRRALPWALFGATVLVLAISAWVLRTGTNNAVPLEPVRLQIALPTKPPMRLTGGLALSPDGRQLAFIATSADGVPRIWVRALNSLEIRPLSGTDSVGSMVFWSPDSRFIGFDSGGKLQKMDVSGGPAETVCSLNLMGVGGSWNKDGTIIFGQYGGPLMRVSSAGGSATPLTVLDTSHGDVAHIEPYFLPDGRHFLYMRGSNTDGIVSIGSLDAKPAQQDYKRLVQATGGVAYATTSGPRLRPDTFPARTNADGPAVRCPPSQDFRRPGSSCGRTRDAVLGHRRLHGFAKWNAGLLAARKSREPAHLVRRAGQGSEHGGTAWRVYVSRTFTRRDTSRRVLGPVKLFLYGSSIYHGARARGSSLIRPPTPKTLFGPPMGAASYSVPRGQPGE